MEKSMQDPVPRLNLVNGYLLTEGGRRWHRVICRRYHGDFPYEWHVHHIDGDKVNNAPENLIAIPERLHARLHDEARKSGGKLPIRQQIIESLDRWLQASPRERQRFKVFSIEAAVRKNRMEKRLEKELRKKQRKAVAQSLRQAGVQALSQLVADFVRSNPDKVQRIPAQPFKQDHWTRIEQKKTKFVQKKGRKK